MMTEDIFPCNICDQREVCNGDLCHEERQDAPPAYFKKDTGKWVVKQPNGLLCYYDAEEGKVILMDQTRDQIIDYRCRTCGIPVSEIARDTDGQLEFQPFRWEDVKK